jgi:HSP20 family molecular chaperone IbpA
MSTSQPSEPGSPPPPVPPSPNGNAGDQEQVLLTPPIDIYATDDGLALVADLPGVTIETLDLQVQDNRLTLFGRVKPAAPSGARVLHREFVDGDFLRSFILSDDVDHERISARLTNGVLEVALPKSPGGRPRRIQVNAE